MKWLFVLLVGVLIYKDVSYLLVQDRYVLRGLTQGVALAVGLVWLVTYFSPAMMRRYWPAFLYIFSLSISLFTASDVFSASIQALSVTAVILFSIAYVDSSRIKSIQHPMDPLLYTTVIIFSLVFLVGLIFNIVKPGMVYEQMYSGAMRFRGIFGEPATMGAASGLALGVALVGIKKTWLKTIVLLLAAPSLVLTFSRTFWIATAFSGLLTVWFYYPKLKKVATTAFVICLIVVSIVFLLDLKVDTQGARQIVRADSAQSMSGRTEIWNRAFQTFLESPVSGHGFTMGVNAAFGGRRLEGVSVFNDDSKINSGVTLHSGYIQALVDLGVLGFVAYMIVIFLPILRLKKYDVKREFAAEFYILNFLWVGNIAQNTIYSGGAFISVIFWIVAVFGLSVRPGNRNNMKSSSI